jgi:hypothetical protein
MEHRLPFSSADSRRIPEAMALFLALFGPWWQKGSREPWAPMPSPEAKEFHPRIPNRRHEFPNASAASLAMPHADRQGAGQQTGCPAKQSNRNCRPGAGDFKD